jgi:hypothetical protein
MDMGQRNCYSRGVEQENKALVTNGASRKKHAGRKKKQRRETRRMIIRTKDGKGEKWKEKRIEEN